MGTRNEKNLSRKKNAGSIVEGTTSHKHKKTMERLASAWASTWFNYGVTKG